MTISAKRAVSAILGLTAAVVGLWAQFGPRSWYEDFPIPGHRWVSLLGAYNEHLARDVGGLYLALLAISVWAVLRPAPETFRIVGTGWTVFCIPHLIFHLEHLEVFPPADLIGNVVVLAASALLAVSLLLPDRAARPRGPRAAQDARAA